MNRPHSEGGASVVRRHPQISPNLPDDVRERMREGAAWYREHQPLGFAPFPRWTAEGVRRSRFRFAVAVSMLALYRRGPIDVAVVAHELTRAQEQVVEARLRGHLEAWFPADETDASARRAALRAWLSASSYAGVDTGELPRQRVGA